MSEPGGPGVPAGAKSPKCYERVPLHTLEQFALGSGYPTNALHAALDWTCVQDDAVYFCKDRSVSR
eukprot:3718981-Amphidinium_carterae.1